MKVSEKAGKELIVASNGSPVLPIEPTERRRPVKEVFADVYGQVVYHDDILEPTTEEWSEL